MKYRRTAVVAFVVASLGLALPSWAGSGENLLQYFPQSSSVVVSIDVEQLRGTSLYQTVWGMIAANPEVQEGLTMLQTVAGFDPNRDVSTATMVLSSEAEERGVGIIEGTFNVAQITGFLSTLEATEMASMEYGGRTVYYDPSEAGPDGIYFTFLSDNMLAIGTQAELSALVDVAAGTGGNITSNASLSGLVSGIDKSGIGWAGGIMTPAMTAELAESPMAGMQTFRVAANMNGGLNVSYVLGTDSAESATGMSTFLSAGLQEARTAPEVAQMGLASVFDMVTISAAGQDVNINVAVPETTLNQILGIITALIAAEQMATPPPAAPQQ